MPLHPETRTTANSNDISTIYALLIVEYSTLIFINNTLSTSNSYSVLNSTSNQGLHMKKIPSKKAKKLVRWHDNFVIFVTPEAKSLGWNDNTIVKVSVEKDKIVIEELGRV